MRRSVTVVTLAALALALGPPAAVAEHSGPDRIYVRYAQIRDQLKGCALDPQGGALGGEKRRQCLRLRRLYRLYSYYGHPGTSFYTCRTSRCPPSPLGVPDPRRPAPGGAVRLF